ncbi:MAG TPA: hypothetical protein VK660_10220 [Xanthomonadaceae bacterium]|jgi:hypothetical protein|nr:hypothetical protein [Xanthomonadaceae bacterium]
MLTGKGKRVVCRRCDAVTFERHFVLFDTERLRAQGESLTKGLE